MPRKIMSTEQAVSRFEVNLSGDILKDIATSEKLFKSDCIDGDAREGDNTHVQRASIQLERVAEGGIVKLLIAGTPCTRLSVQLPLGGFCYAMLYPQGNKPYVMGLRRLSTYLRT